MRVREPALVAQLFSFEVVNDLLVSEIEKIVGHVVRPP